MEDRVKQIHDIAIENLKQDGYVVPVLIVEGKENAIVSLSGAKDKYEAMRQAGRKAAFLSPSVVIFISEAWVARKMPPEGEAVHDMLDKQECISIVAQKSSGEGYACFVPFSKVGKQIFIGETEWLPEGGVVQANLLKPFWLGVKEKGDK